MGKSFIQKLRDRGFDLTVYNADHSWSPRCSQCEAIVIMGLACHELGCPNSKGE